MEKINYRFLNYKHYNKFLQDLNNDKVREDAIVFIQDNLHPCIWARGKEYVCEGPFSSRLDGIDGLTLRNGSDQLLLQILPGSTGIQLQDGRGVVVSYDYASLNAFKDFVSTVTDNINTLRQTKVDLEDMNNLSSKYNQLEEKLRNKQNNIFAGNGIAIDESNVISVDLSILGPYEKVQDHINDLNAKQDKLTAGDGIDIENNVISTKIDTELYVLVTSLPSPEEADQNKIYILELSDGQGGYIYTQHRVRFGQWISIGTVAPNVNLEEYLKKSDAGNLYQSKREDYVITSDLLEYTPLSRTINIETRLADLVTYDYLTRNYQIAGDYSEKEWVERYFVKKTDLYTPIQPDDVVIGQTDPVTPGEITVPTTGSIEVDFNLDDTSSNPVANFAIANALSLKADKAELFNYVTKESIKNKIDTEVLNNYATKDELATGLRTKQNNLIPKHGISIINDEISSTLDVDVFIIVDNLQSVLQPNTNKIYLVETEVDGELTYVEYRYINNDWVEIGPKTPGIDLTEYIKESAADNKYQLQGDYLTRSEAASIYQTIDDYATDEQIEELIESLDNYALKSQLDALRLNINNTFQKKGSYVSSQDVSNALTILQQIIDRKYVLKKDVYNLSGMSGWSTEDPTTISVGGSTGGNSSGGVSVQSNMVTLTTQQYQLLVDNNLVDENTYYFTYEADETNNWTFGDTFPIIFHEESGIGTFPIVLGEDNIGTFPINLT